MFVFWEKRKDAKIWEMLFILHAERGRNFNFIFGAPLKPPCVREPQCTSLKEIAIFLNFKLFY